MNISWIFIGRADAETEAPILWPSDGKSRLIGKDPDTGKDWRHEEKRVTEDEVVGWHHWINKHVWPNSRREWRTGKPGVLQSIGSQTVGHNWATEQDTWKRMSESLHSSPESITMLLIGYTSIEDVSESESCSGLSNPLQPHRPYSPGNSPALNTGVGSLSLLQGIFPTQGSNPGLLHCKRILYQLKHKGSPRILEWVAYLFSSGYSWPKNWIGVSCIAGRYFTNWAIREAQ